MAPDLERILDDCIEKMRSGHSIDEILSQYPESADTLKKLLSLIVELEGLPEPNPVPDAAARTIARLALESRQKSSKRIYSASGRMKFFSKYVLARVAAILIIVSLLGWGMVSVSSASVPGDLFYPVKIFTERAKFFITINSEDRAELRLVFSEERFNETVKKHLRGEGIKKELLVKMLDEARAALQEGIDLPADSRGLLTTRISCMTAYQKEVLNMLKERASPEEKKELESCINVCGKRMLWMQEMMTEMGMTSSSPSSPSSPIMQGTEKPSAQKKMMCESELKDSRQMMQRWMKECPMWQDNTDDNSNR